MVYLSCKNTKAQISNIGAELRSFKVDKIEYIWQADKYIWNESAPLLFPICSSLKDDEYIYKGRIYKLRKHGFARFKVFEVEHKTNNTVTFLLKSNSSTKTNFPFDYELRITYTLTTAKLDIKYEVKNISEETMYFSIGAHEGYSIPYGLENYQIEFPQSETLYNYVFDGSVLTGEKKLVLEDSNVLPLKCECFTDDALIFKDLKSRSAIIKPNNGKKRIKVTFDGFDYFLIWTVPNANFLCLEPWCGITDNIDHDKDITKKEGINALSSNEAFVRSHSIEIF